MRPPLPVLRLESVNEPHIFQPGAASQVGFKCEIINKCGKELTILSRDGLSFTLPSQRAQCMADRAIFFQQTVTLERDVITDLTYVDQVPDPKHPSIGECLIDSILAFQKNRSYVQNGYMGKLLFKVTLDELNNNGGSVYLSGLDLVLTTDSRSTVIRHPYSKDGMLERLRPFEIDDAAICIAIFYVDNKGTKAPRYINWQGRVFKIPRRAADRLEDGFYIVQPNVATAGDGPTEHRTYHYTMEEAEKLYHLYRSAEEAETYGFSKEALERENLSEKRKQQQLERSYAEAEIERKERLKAEAEAHASNELKRKEREAWRKEFMEFLKFGSSIVAACLTLAGIIVRIGLAVKK